MQVGLQRDIWLVDYFRPIDWSGIFSSKRAGKRCFIVNNLRLSYVGVADIAACLAQGRKQLLLRS